MSHVLQFDNPFLFSFVDLIFVLMSEIYMNGPLPYVRHHITVYNVLSELLNKIISFLPSREVYEFIAHD